MIVRHSPSQPKQTPLEDDLVPKAILQVASVQRIHGEKLDAILKLLTPDEGARQGPSLEELLKGIADRMDAQLDYLRLITGELRRQGEEMPGDVAKAVLDARSPGLGSPTASGGRRD